MAAAQIIEQTNKYANGKIYTIRSHQTDKYYIGSTCDSLSKRLYEHRKKLKLYNTGKYNNVSSFDIIQYDDHYIELLELFPCNSKIELTSREGHFIRLHKNDLVNVKIEGRTQKEYNEDNKEAIVEWKKQFYIDNKETLSEKAKITIVCICGSELRKADKSRHEKSTKHTNYITSQITHN
jgi:hypothetical protein